MSVDRHELLAAADLLGLATGMEETDTVLRCVASFPDGIVVIGADRRMIFVNVEAGQILGARGADLAGQKVDALGDFGGYDWEPVLEALDRQSNGEFVLRGGLRGSVYATLRRIAGDAGGMVLQLRDLQVFDHARRRASGLPQAGRSPGGERKVRPDFLHQRQICPSLDRTISLGERALMQDVRVIITGESGVGKTEIARYLHRHVSEASEPFIVVNCAAIPETLFESELFGYEKGAFTGALSSGKKGLIEQAEGGTLFLDEVGEIPLHLQSKLLTFLEEGTVQRVGGTRPKSVHVRVISATNRDLLDMVRARQFRRDLFHRLAVVKLPVRPLRETPELISHLIDRFVWTTNQRRSDPLVLSDAMRARLMAYGYPGNVRELFNIIQQIAILGEDDLPLIFEAEPAAHPIAGGEAGLPCDGESLKTMVGRYERQLIDAAIARHGSKRKAAAALDVDIGTIVRKTKPAP
ncbi:sigma 54-interacting transcriptional regulator [Stappia sp.]|uniref:sigma-54 interaction domain-containing protein n=1 Tax=Stappia sp. TaxID=1870903 RepID=UPI0032D917E5